MESMASYFSTGVAGAITLSVIAFSTVFLVLTGLTFIILGVRLLAAPFEGRGKVPDKKKPGAPPKASSKAPGPSSTVAAVQPSAPPATVSQAGDTGRIVAAITAALVSYRQDQDFQISSIVPEGQASGKAGRPASLWKQTGMVENLASLDRQIWRSS